MLNSSARTSDSSKLENLGLALKCGLLIPQTIATNELAVGRPELGNEVIVKPLAGGQLTKMLGDVLKTWDGGAPLQSYPHFLQPRLARPEIRAYLVGDDIHSFTLNSEDLDYRERHRATISPIALPSQLDRGLRNLCGELGLDFAAADFMLRDDGEYCFLEINAQPMFYAFDLVAEGRLVDSILDWLVNRFLKSSSDAT